MCIPGSGIAGSDSNSVFNISRNFHTIFYGSCTMIYSLIFVECFTDCSEKVCAPWKHDRKGSEVNSLLSDSAPWLLKQVNLLETLPSRVCPHTAVCTLTNRCMPGNKSFENHGGNALRIYGSGPFENGDRLPCNPTVQRNPERLAGGLKGSEPHRWSAGVNEDELSREHLE